MKRSFSPPPTTDYYWGHGLGDVQFLPYILQSSVVIEYALVPVTIVAPIGGLDEDQSKRFRFPKRL